MPHHISLRAISEFWHFPHKKTISRSFLPPVVLWKGSYLIYVICVHLHMVVSYTYLLCKQHDRCHIRGRNCLPFGITWVTSGCLVDSMFLIFFSFVLFFCCIFFGGGVVVLYLLCSMLPVTLDFHSWLTLAIKVVILIPTLTALTRDEFMLLHLSSFCGRSVVFTEYCSCHHQ